MVRVSSEDDLSQGDRYASRTLDATARPLVFYSTQPTNANAKLNGPLPAEAREALLLRLLTTSTEGGSPITDAIGAWLRGLGANALIYGPSTN